MSATPQVPIWPPIPAAETGRITIQWHLIKHSQRHTSKIFKTLAINGEISID